jgi:hypothetical protein
MMYKPHSILVVYLVKYPLFKTIQLIVLKRGYFFFYCHILKIKKTTAKEVF